MNSLHKSILSGPHVSPQGQCRPMHGCSRSMSCSRAQRTATHAVGDGGELQRREQARKLSRLFYGSTAVKPTGDSSSSSSSSSSKSDPSGSFDNRDACVEGATSDASTGASALGTTSTSSAAMLDAACPAPTSDAETTDQHTSEGHNSKAEQQQRPGDPQRSAAVDEPCLDSLFYEGCSIARSVPLWRVQEVMLPGGCQCILHVHRPHYCSMFERMFNSQQGYHTFGHLYLPAGSENLGKPEYALESGSKAPLIGTLMEVNRAVRTLDGKLIILANSLCRFKVVTVHQELPYAVADVALLHDVEWLDAFQARALDIAMRTAPDDAPIHCVMDAASAAALAGAGWQESAWLGAYELHGARQHGMWGASNPREGGSAEETSELVQDVVQHGVQQVTSMASDDGTLAHTISTMADKATWAAMEAATAVSLSAPLCQDAQGGDHEDWLDRFRPSTGANGAQHAAVTSLNTVAERGLTVMAPTGEASTSGDDLLQLEASLWHELDTIVQLAVRVRGKDVPLPHGLMQLRLKPTATARSEAASSTGSACWLLRPPELGAQPVHVSSAPGVTHAPEHYPPLRRVLRLSWVAAKALAVADTAEQWQALLECASIAGRLRITLAELEKQRKVLAAVVALKSLDGM